MSEERGDPLWIDVERVLATAGAGQIGVAIDLIMLVWWPTKSAFVYDEEVLAKLFAEKLPGRGYTPAKLRKYRKAAAIFFTVLPDGRWTPSPEFFSLTDGNAEALAARFEKE
jgi:hypothetical protein